MRTLTGLLMQSAGLSEKEAARLFKTDRKTVRLWLAGEVETPSAVTKELYSLIDLQEHAGKYVLELVRREPPEKEVKVCIGDDEITAELQGWPAAAGAALMNGAVRRFFEMANDDIRARTQVVYNPDKNGTGSGVKFFNIRIRPDGSFAKVDDPPELDDEA